MAQQLLSEICGMHGNEGCPCILSDLNRCLICSHLQGKELCDCRWSGYCVYIGHLHDRQSRRVTYDRPVPLRCLDLGASGLLVYLAAPDSTLRAAKPGDRVLIKYCGAVVTASVVEVFPENGVMSLSVAPSETGTDIFKGPACMELLPL